MHATLREIYQSLESKLEEASLLDGVQQLLYWDQEVVMPSGGAECRAKQIAAMAGIIHEKITHPDLGDWLNALERAESPIFNPKEWRNIQEAKREYELKTKVPANLVREMAEKCSMGQTVWIKARKENRFADFAPILSELIALHKQWAQYAHPQLDPYDANIDRFERGATAAMITPLFEKLKSKLIPLIAKIGKCSHKVDASFLEGEFSVEKQEELGKQISRDLGFSFENGRMDVSVHPFCGGSHPTDVRITTRFRPDIFLESIYAIIHETGHGLYEQGRMRDASNLPVSESLTSGIHESQSLFWERMVGQTKEFCDRYIDSFRAAFPEALGKVTSKMFYEGLNHVQPGFIRVRADELTYPMHIILRYELERGLFDGSIQVDELPERWNDKMEEYLGIRPATDADGVLQDIHWSGGLFGYFPTYSLGAIYACQFFKALSKELPTVKQLIQRGDFKPIKSWLNVKIHRQGKLYSADELVTRVTGEPLNIDSYISYLEHKYAEIYGLN